MARRRAADTAARRIASLRSWVTPDEQARIAAEAKAAGAGLSDYIRELCLRRPVGTAPRVRANPEAKALADELNAIGINLNQLARVANQTGELRREEALDEALFLLRTAIGRVLTL